MTIVYRESGNFKLILNKEAISKLRIEESFWKERQIYSKRERRKFVRYLKKILRDMQSISFKTNEFLLVENSRGVSQLEVIERTHKSLNKMNQFLETRFVFFLKKDQKSCYILDCISL